MTSANAARLVEHGKPLSVEQVELPSPSDDEVLVELRFASVNPVDRYAAEGKVAADGPLPRTLGQEATGFLDGAPVLVAGEGLGAKRDGVFASAAVRLSYRCESQMSAAIVKNNSATAPPSATSAAHAASEGIMPFAVALNSR